MTRWHMSPVRSGFCLQRYVAGAVCALLLLSEPSWPASTPDAKPLTAILIVARDDLPDSIFADSIVLVMNNLGPGPVGIIINRPMPIPVSRLFPELKRLAQARDTVYFGGPLDFESVWFLFRAATPPEHAIQAFDGVYLSADRQLLLQLLGRDKPMDSLRIFVGHAGWAPGQLEAEIERRDWTLKRAEAEAIFSGKSEHPWPPPPIAGRLTGSRHEVYNSYPRALRSSETFNTKGRPCNRYRSGPRVRSVSPSCPTISPAVSRM